MHMAVPSLIMLEKHYLTLFLHDTSPLNKETININMHSVKHNK